MITLSICWKAVWATLLLIDVFVACLGWVLLTAHLLSENNKSKKVFGWISLGLMVSLILVMIYFVIAKEMCGV